MKFRVVHQPTPNRARSPFRVVEQTTGREVEWVNRYLDLECLRRVADLTLRSYAQHLLHFIRWWESVHHTDAIAEDALNGSTLLDYVRFQSGQQPEFSGSTINQRVAVADRALRATFPSAPRQIAPGLQVNEWSWLFSSTSNLPCLITRAKKRLVTATVFDRCFIRGSLISPYACQNREAYPTDQRPGPDLNRG